MPAPPNGDDAYEVALDIEHDLWFGPYPAHLDGLTLQEHTTLVERISAFLTIAVSTLRPVDSFVHHGFVSL